MLLHYFLGTPILPAAHFPSFDECRVLSSARVWIACCSNAGIPCASHLSGFHIELRKDKMVYFGIFQNTKTPGGIGCRIYQHISGIRASGIRHNSTVTKWFTNFMHPPIVTASISRLSKKMPFLNSWQQIHMFSGALWTYETTYLDHLGPQ